MVYTAQIVYKIGFRRIFPPRRLTLSKEHSPVDVILYTLRYWISNCFIGRTAIASTCAKALHTRTQTDVRGTRWLIRFRYELIASVLPAVVDFSFG